MAFSLTLTTVKVVQCLTSATEREKLDYYRGNDNKMPSKNGLRRKKVIKEAAGDITSPKKNAASSVIVAMINSVCQCCCSSAEVNRFMLIYLC